MCFTLCIEYRQTCFFLIYQAAECGGLATMLSESSALRDAERSALRWRKEAGRLACLYQGTGPTGGFCMNVSAAEAEKRNNYCLPVAMATELASLLAGASVLDLGCGVGAYGDFFRQHAPAVRWTGVDGSEGIEEATSRRVRFVDLSEGLPTDLSHSWDFKMSIEVAEHVPRSGEPMFIHNLLSGVKRAVVLSWARLGQSGHAHRSCQSMTYVKCALSLFGFTLDRQATRSLQSQIAPAEDWKTAEGSRANMQSICPWLAHTLMVFRPGRGGRDGGSANKLELLRQLQSRPTPAFGNRYLNLTAERCPLTAEYTSCDATRRPAGDVASGGAQVTEIAHGRNVVDSAGRRPGRGAGAPAARRAMNYNSTGRRRGGTGGIFAAAF